MNKLNAIFESEVRAINMTLEWTAEFIKTYDTTAHWFIERRYELLKQRHNLIQQMGRNQ